MALFNPPQLQPSYEWDLPPTDSSYTPTSELWRSPLCKVCRAIFTGPLGWQQRNTAARNRLDQNVQGLRYSAETCHLCHLRWDQLTAQDRVEFADCSDISYFFFDGPDAISGLVFEYKIQSRTIWLEFKLILDRGRRTGLGLVLVLDLMLA